MAYSSQSDIQATSAMLIALTDDAGAGVIDATKITAAIARADGLIDSYLPGIPLATTPALITVISSDLAFYELVTRRADIFSMPDWLEERHKQHMETLARIRRGEIDIGTVEAKADRVNTDDGTDLDEYAGRLFTATTLENF